MNINTNVYKQYVKSGSTRKAPELFYSGVEKAEARKTDSFSLSSNASMFRECGRVIKSAVAEASSPAPDERINAIRQKIQDGSYSVSAGQVADAILGRNF